MSIEATEIPQLVVRNPVWLWMFRHGVEDPNWGRRPIDQLTLAVAIHELAGQISDMDLRKQVQGGVAKLLLDAAQGIVEESHSGDQQD